MLGIVSIDGRGGGKVFIKYVIEVNGGVLVSSCHPPQPPKVSVIVSWFGGLRERQKGFVLHNVTEVLGFRFELGHFNLVSLFRDNLRER